MCVPYVSCAEAQNTAEGYDRVSLERGVNESISGEDKPACGSFQVSQFHGGIINDDDTVKQGSHFK